jgi:sulfur-carrier protein
MPTVRIPTPLRGLTNGQAQVAVEAGDLRTVLANLEVAHPGVGDRLIGSDGDLRRFVNLFVGDQDVRFLQGLDTPVGPDDVISIVPAVAGG